MHVIAWSATKGDEEEISCFERRVLRRMHRPILIDEVFNNRANRKVCRIYQKTGINALTLCKVVSSG